MKEQGGFFLRAGQRDPKIARLLLSENSRGREAPGDQFLNATVAQWLGLNAVKSGGYLAFGQELNRSDAIAADGLQQIEGLDGTGGEFRANPAADGSRVGEEVVEVVLHLFTADRLIAGREGQRERKRPAGGGLDPGMIILQNVLPPAHGPSPHTDAIHPNRERRSGGHVTSLLSPKERF